MTDTKSQTPANGDPGASPAIFITTPIFLLLVIVIAKIQPHRR